MADELTFLVEDAELVFKNFSGAPNQFNTKGDRSTCVFLDDDVAEQMLKDGWNVKYTKPREDDEEPNVRPYINVAFRFDIKPPNVWLVTSKARTRLDEDTIEVLDWTDMGKVDLFARAYEWNIPTGSGIKAYAKTLVVHMIEDPLEEKYGLVPTSPSEDGTLEEIDTEQVVGKGEEHGV